MRTGGRRFADTDVLVGMEGEKENMARSRAGSCVEFHNVKVRVLPAFSEGGFLPSCLGSALCASLVHTPPLLKNTEKINESIRSHTDDQISESLFVPVLNPADQKWFCSDWNMVSCCRSVCVVLPDAELFFFLTVFLLVTDITGKQQVRAFVAAGRWMCVMYSMTSSFFNEVQFQMSRFIEDLNNFIKGK